MAKKLKIVKSSKRLEAFSDEKLMNSLILSGASLSEAKNIVANVKGRLHEGASTRLIYRLAFQKLWKYNRIHASVYNLKNSILKLGPSGFHFEKFVHEIYKMKGYKISKQKIWQGCCVKHEVDMVAIRDDKTVFSECKFHNILGKKNDIKIALYVQARAEDLRKGKNLFKEFCLITNTSFSADAIEYAKCSGLKLISLNYPESEALGDIIRTYKIFPVTVLRSLRQQFIPALLDSGIITVRQLFKNLKILDQLKMSPDEKRRLVHEIESLMSVK